MVKLVYCIRKRADLSHEGFLDYWLNRHGPYMRSLAGQMRSRRYVQSHTLSTPIHTEFARARGLEQSGYDGVIEMWWNSMEDLLAAVGTPEGLALAQQYIAYEASFIDFSQSCMFLTEEHVAFDYTGEAGAAPPSRGPESQ